MLALFRFKLGLYMMGAINDARTDSRCRHCAAEFSGVCRARAEHCERRQYLRDGTRATAAVPLLALDAVSLPGPNERSAMR